MLYFFTLWGYQNLLLFSKFFIRRMDIWRWMNGLSLIPGIFLLIASAFLLPESPRWLVSIGQNDRALATLRRIRIQSSEAEAELETIKALHQGKDLAEEQIGLWALASRRWLRNCSLVGLGIAFSQQAIGVAAPMYYGTEILERVGMETKLAMIVNVAIGVSFGWKGL